MLLIPCSAPRLSVSFVFHIFIAAVYEKLLLKESLGNYVLCYLIITVKTLSWSCPIVCFYSNDNINDNNNDDNNKPYL